MTTNRRLTLVFWTCCAATLVSACSKSSGSAETGNENIKRLVEAPTKPELELLEDAKRSYDKGLFKISIESWTALRDGYPASYYAILAEIKTADSYFYAQQYPEAITAYQEFIRGHSGHEAVPYVKYQIALASFLQYQGLGHDQTPLRTAITKFEELIADAPRSEYATAARARIKDCRELLAENEAQIAEFYLRQGKTGSSTARYEGLIANYADTDSGREKAQSLRQKIISDGAVDERSLAQVAAPARLEGDPVAPVIVSAVADSSAASRKSTVIKSGKNSASNKSEQPASPTIVGAIGGAIVEDNLIPGGEQSNVVGADFVSSMKCVEQSDGAQLITVLLNDEPEVIGEQTESSNLILKFRRRGNSSTKQELNVATKIQSCRVGELAAEISAEKNEMTLKTSGKAIANYTQLVLDRPYRLAVIVR